MDGPAKQIGVGDGEKTRALHPWKAEVAQRFAAQPSVDTITLKVDSDHVGGIWARGSTSGLAAFHRRRLITVVSTTQTVIALSSDESEFYAIVRGAATVLGFKNTVWDYTLGQDHERDGLGGRSRHVLRLGAAKVRHVETGVDRVAAVRGGDPGDPRGDRRGRFEKQVLEGS